MSRPLARLRALLAQPPARPTQLALLGFAGLALFYFWHLDANLINDDEGSYLYAAWRISLGELPYRDFLTPQLPAFLMPGGWLMRLVGPEVWPLRAFSAVFSLGAGVFTWLTARRLFGAGVALVAGLAFTLHPLVYYYGRLYRAEPSMLFFAAVGSYAFARAAFPQPAPTGSASELPGVLPEPEPVPAARPWLLVSGAAFGLAILCKLFGALPLAGCGLWLLIDGLRRRRIGPMLVDGVLLSASAALVAGLPLLWFRSISANLEQAVLEHHLMQGSQQTLISELAKTLEFYYQFVDADQGALLLFAGIAVAVLAWRRGDRRVLLFGCQLVSLLGFFLLTRDLFIRHLMYLLPSLATLAGLALVPLIVHWRQLARPEGASTPPAPSTSLPTARLGGALALGLLAALALPWTYANVVLGLETETATARLADFISLVTAPDAQVFGDFSELNFYAQRPTSYEGASMSAGAAASGQLAWSVVSPPLEARRPALLVNLSAARHDVGHLQYMPDYADYLAWMEQHYVKLGGFERDWQSFLLYEPKDAPLPRLARHPDGPTLLAARPAKPKARAGDAIEVLTAWQNGPPEEPLTEYVATLRLIDPTGQQWAQQDSSLFAYPDRKSPRWAPDELTSQRLAVTLPPDTPPGTYRLEVGLYRRNGADVPRLDPAGQPVYDRALAGTIQVGPGPLNDIPSGTDGVTRLDRPLAGLTLLGHGPLPDAPITAGATLPLDLWWRSEPTTDASPPPDRLWIGLDGEREANADSDAAGPGGLPQSLGIDLTTLAPGTVYRQRAHLAVPLDRAPGPAQLQLELLDAHGQPLLPASTPLGTLDIDSPAPESARQPLARHPGLAVADDIADFGRARFAFDLDDVPAPVSEAMRPPEGATTLNVTLDWRALRHTDSPWSLSLQLHDPSAQPIAQVDAPAGGWEHPSSAWLAGEMFSQQLALELPDALSPGTYPLILALYNPATGYRAPMRGPDAAGDHLDLGSLQVGPP